MLRALVVACLGGGLCVLQHWAGGLEVHDSNRFGGWVFTGVARGRPPALPNLMRRTRAPFENKLRALVVACLDGSLVSFNFGWLVA
jgi:hypothetical protein